MHRLVLGVWGLMLWTPLAFVRAQTTYFPPLSGNVWASVSSDSLGWCTERIDSLDAFLERKGTKGFAILVNGKMAHERYYGAFAQDSLWYWASAGKTLTAIGVGFAQHEGLLQLSDSSSRFLGAGWTSLTPAQERQIQIIDQLRMTTGLDDGAFDPDCTVPSCLVYKAAPGTRWAYHNAPYTLLQTAVESASGLGFDAFLHTRIKTPIGMGGFYAPSGFNKVYVSRLRDMARFGLLIASQGEWNGQTIFPDSAYFYDMTHPSQTLNPSYGYLWWLNGQGTHMLPQTQWVFNGPLIPSAPVDLIAALGKNDQKIYVVPSRNWVVVRMGESAGQSLWALSSFDTELWNYLNALECGIGVQEAGRVSVRALPNPAVEGRFRLEGIEADQPIEVFDRLGRPLPLHCDNLECALPPGVGLAFLVATDDNGNPRVIRLWVP